MLTVALETSGRIGSVALGRADVVLEVRRMHAPRRHSVEFLPMMSAMCENQGVFPRDIELIAVSCGPGSFTGLRIGVTTARMIALATGARIAAVPTLDVIAQNALDAEVRPQRLVVILDAKRQRVYAAAFDLRDGRYVRITDPTETEPRAFLHAHEHSAGHHAVLGEGVAYHSSAVSDSGWVVLPEELNAPRSQTVLAMGNVLAQFGQFINRRALVPTYIRPPEAEEKWLARNQI